MTTSQRRAVSALVALLAVLATGLATVLVQVPGTGLSDAWWLVAVATFLLEVRPVSLRFGENTHTITLSETVITVGLMTVHPLALLAGQLVGGVPLMYAVQRARGVKLAFNIALLAASSTMASTLFHALADRPWALVPRTWASALVAAAIAWVLSAGSVQLVIRLATGTRTTQSVDRDALGVAALVGVGTSTVAVVGLFLAQGHVLDVVLLGPPVAVVAFAASRQAREADRNRALRFSMLAAESLRQHPEPHALVLASLPEIATAYGARAGLALVRTPDGPCHRHLAGDEGGPGLAELAAALDAEVEPATRVVGAEHPDLGPVLAANGWRDALWAPLSVEGAPVGGIVLADRTVRPFDDDDVELAATLAATASSALARAWMGRQLAVAHEAQADLERRATHDALTGLSNRARFEQVLARTPDVGGWALLYLDLNGFKPVNDTHGHAAGDRILVETARRLAENARDGDEAFRLGGDEFGLFVATASVAHAQAVARRVQAALGRPVDLGTGVALPISASIGIAVRQGATPPAEVVARADAAMYAAKATGDAAVVTWTPDLARHTA